MNTAADARATPLGRRISAGAVAVGGAPPSALAEFEAVYRTNVDVVMAYFARRCADPQAVADLTSETFVRAAGAFGSFDPRRGSPRAWLFGIAAHVFARHCADSAEARGPPPGSRVTAGLTTTRSESSPPGSTRNARGGS